MPISQTLTVFPPAPDSSDTPEVFNASADAYVAHQVSTYIPEMNILIGQINTLQGEVNLAQTNTYGARDLTLSYRDQTLTARDLAYASANFAGAWDITTDFGGKSVIFDGIAYASLVSPNVGNQPDLSPTKFAPLQKSLSIDEIVSHLSSLPATYDANGKVSEIPYTTGNKEVLTYLANGKLDKVEYTDTDGTTVLLTETQSYFANGKWSHETRT